MRYNHYKIQALFLLIYFNFGAYAQNNYYAIEKLGPHINTAADEITPIVDWDGKVLYFTRVGAADFNRNLIIEDEDQATVLSSPEYDILLKEVYGKIAKTYVLDPIHSSFNQDIWIANSIEKEFDRIVHPPAPLNNALPNSICAMLPQLRTFIVINQFIPGGGMDVGFSVVTQINENEWTFPAPVTIDNYYTLQSGTSTCISSDGQVMILALKRNETIGETDLYICFKQGENTWSEPQNLGPKVNTKWSEVTPYLSLDMKRLYFASNRKTSTAMGGMDLYFIEREGDSWDNWSEEKQFVAPINSKFDDSQPYFSSSTGHFYFTSRRDGSTDIYRVQIAPAMPQTVTIRGKITNAKDNQPIDADIIFAQKGTDDLRISYSKNGEYAINIPKGMEYKFMPQMEGYITSPMSIKVEKYQHYPNGYKMDFTLVPIEEGEKITLHNIYFKQSESEMLEKSYEELTDLADLLQEYKKIHIQIEGHTDNTGQAADLLSLSEKRATAIKDFLIQKNIKTERIEVKGFGGTQPVFQQPKTEAERQANRRVEIRITKK